MTRTLSQKFRFFTFICIALLVYVHGYNLKDNYLAPYSTVNEPMTFTTFFEYLFANGLLRFRIPMLFMISGYLYALYDHRSYGDQIKSRFKTLLVPYFIWSAFGLLLTFLLQQNTYTAQVVFNANLDQLGDNRPYTEIGWQGMLNRWIAAPIAYQVWFLSTLFVFNLIYPVIRWLVVKIPFIWLPLTFIYFFFLVYLPFLDSRGLLFFSLGVWIQKKNYDIEREPKWFSLGLTFILFIGLNVIKTFMAFELDPYEFRTANEENTTAVTLVFVYQFSIFFGILAMWFGANRVIHWFIKRKWFQLASQYSFFIFGMHVPLLPYVMTWALATLQFLPNYRIICYLLIPLLVLMLCIYTGKLLKFVAPKIYAIVTGGRGF